MKSTSSRASSNSIDPADAFIKTLDMSLVASLALGVRRNTLLSESTPSDLTCAVYDTPESGSYNVVYRAKFSDGLSWAVRVRYTPWGPSRARQMKLDMIGLQYIMDRTSLPIPRVHAYDCGTDNILGHSYIVMDFVHGTRLSDVWKEPSWWMGERSRERLVTSIARYMVELSKLEFDRIGALDRPDPDGPHEIVSFTLPAEEDPRPESDTLCGPYDSTYAYLHGMLNARIRERGSWTPYTMCQLFIGVLVNSCYDGPPFTLSPPDFDSQNIIVDDSGNIVAFIDWDGVHTKPRRLGTLSYPAWLDVDWDPFMYQGYQLNPNYDREEDLHRFRGIYSNAVDTLSGGTLGDVVRNAHVLCSLVIAIISFPCSCQIIFNLSRYVFGTRLFTIDILEGIETSAWSKQDPHEIARIIQCTPSLSINALYAVLTCMSHDLWVKFRGMTTTTMTTMTKITSMKVKVMPTP